MKYFLTHSQQFAIWLMQQFVQILTARARFYQGCYRDLNRD